jgi:hypothetical protein
MSGSTSGIVKFADESLSERPGDNPGFDVSPCFAATLEQAFPAHIAFKTIGRSRLRDWHEEKDQRGTRRNRETAYNSLLTELRFRVISWSGIMQMYCNLESVIHTQSNPEKQLFKTLDPAIGVRVHASQ